MGGPSLPPSLLFPPLCPICLVLLFFSFLFPFPLPHCHRPSTHFSYSLLFLWIPGTFVYTYHPLRRSSPFQPLPRLIRSYNVRFTPSLSLFAPPSSIESSPDIIHPFSDTNPRRCIERFRVHWPRYSAPFHTNFSRRREIFLPAFEIHHGEPR